MPTIDAHHPQNGNDIMRIYSYLISLFVILTFSTANAQENNFQVNIGDTQIQVQAPDGFYEATQTFPGAAYLAQTITPPTNRLLAMLLSKDDITNLQNNQNPEMKSYVLIQTLKAWEGLTISQKMFEEGKRQIKDQQHTMMQNAQKEVDKFIDNASKKMSEDTGTKIDIKIGEQKPLGIFFESDDALGFNSLSYVQSTTEEGTFDDVIALSATLARVKGKIIYVYVYKAYKHHEDVDWINKISQEIVQNIINDNLVSKEEETSYEDKAPDFDMNELLKRVGIGAFIGLIIGLFFKSKRKD